MIKLAKNTFISRYSAVMGNVEIGENVSIWPKAVLRADIEYIKIGGNSNVQDGSILHPNHGKPVTVGKNVTIGHNAIVHGCMIGDNCLIGMGAIILDGAVIEENCVIAAGSIVSPGKVVSKGTLWMGAPAKFFRNTAENDLKHIVYNAEEYVRLAQNARDNKEDFI
jgi:carbonic anhydrase/acetyltransferase-like protein (isoleucine patch superfamily)